jgi:hypothetical protein
MDEIREQRVMVDDLLGADGRRLVEELGELPDVAPPDAELPYWRVTFAGGSPRATTSTPSPSTSPRL